MVKTIASLTLIAIAVLKLKIKSDKGFVFAASVIGLSIAFIIGVIYVGDYGYWQIASIIFGVILIMINMYKIREYVK